MAPTSWALARLEDLVAVIRGRASPQESPAAAYIGMDHVEPHTMRILGTVPASTMRSSAVRFERGDVLYGRLRPYLNKVISPLFTGLASAEFIPLTPKAGIEGDFIRYRLNAADFVQFASHLDEGDRPRVDWAGIATFPVLVPPSCEQQRIVAALDSYLSRLDAAVASLEQAHARLKAYRASVLKAAVEGRLVPTEVELARQEGRDYEPASVLLERILAERRRRWEEAELVRLTRAGKVPKGDQWKARYQEPEGPDTAGLPDLPGGWAWATVDQLVYVGTGATPHRGEPRYWTNGSIPWVNSAVVGRSRVNEASDLVTESALRETNLTLYPPGTLLVAMYGEGKTRGRCTELGISATTNQALAALVTEGEAERARPWLRTCLEASYESLRKAASGGVQPNLNLWIVRTTAIPIPPLVEQYRIVEEVERGLSVAAATASSVHSKQRWLARLRQATLKWAFEGKLVDQDPADEPAEALLARIKVERPATTPRKPGARTRKAAP